VKGHKIGVDEELEE
jgi:hypothetical protein